MAILKNNPKIKSKPAGRRERGFTLLLAAACIVGLIGMVGLAVDVGRMYIAKSETQIFSDSASLAATLELDGTTAGIDRALARVASNPNRWNFQTSSYTNYQTAFSKTGGDDWVDYPENPSGYRYARVRAQVDVPVYFMSFFLAPKSALAGPLPFAAAGAGSSIFTASVVGDSAGAQEIKTRFREGVFPFSPFAHSTEGPHYGLVPGQLYTFRWAAAPRLNNNNQEPNVCPGDRIQSIIDLAEAGGGSERGYIEETSASVIRSAIIDTYQTVWRGIGEPVVMTGGAKQTERDALLERVRQDTNWWAATYEQYMQEGNGNGRRIVGMPINTGYPNYIAVQIGAFFLLRTGDYPQGGNREWCAQYLGPWVQGAKQKGAAEDSGAWVVRLVE
jgi:hypothetical protein